MKLFFNKMIDLFFYTFYGTGNNTCSRCRKKHNHVSHYCRECEAGDVSLSLTELEKEKGKQWKYVN